MNPSHIVVIKAKTQFEREPIPAENPEIGFRRLAAAVVISALQDAHGFKDVDACLFLAGEAYKGGWSDLAGIPGCNLLDFLKKGCPKIPPFLQNQYQRDQRKKNVLND